MKIILLLLLLMSCGKQTEYVTTEINNNLTGYYILDGGSSANCIYISQKTENVIDIEADCQELVTVNPENNSLGQFPIITATNLIAVDRVVRYSRNLTYTSGQDIEEDVNGANITGSRRTDIVVDFSNDKMKLTISIYENANGANINEIVAERVFNER